MSHRCHTPKFNRRKSLGGPLAQWLEQGTHNRSGPSRQNSTFDLTAQRGAELRKVALNRPQRENTGFNGRMPHRCHTNPPAARWTGDYGGHEIRLCVVRPRQPRRKILKGSRDVYRLLKDMTSWDREHFVAVFLDAKGTLMGVHTVAIGGLSETSFQPREVFKAAFLLNACSVVLAHNHPTGDVTPSKEDRQATRELALCGRFLGVPVLDHLVIGDGYFSFKERGLIESHP